MNKIIENQGSKDQLKNFNIETFLLGNTEGVIGPNDSFMQNGIINSTGILEQIEFCEETYGITIEGEELVPESLDSLNNLTSFIQRKK